MSKVDPTPFIDTLRLLAVDCVEAAKSGHPGLPLGAAPMAYALWQKHLDVDGTEPRWPNRDRFVLSAGHGSALLYALLHAYGFAVSIDDLKNFRQSPGITPGHPEFEVTPGVEATTGPLGQGAANSVGMAIAERHLAWRFNRDDFLIVDHFTFALLSDGDIMEGVAHEAAAFAGHLKLGRLIWLYDANLVSLDGPTSLSMSEDTHGRFVALGWHVVEVERGDTDVDAICDAITKAKACEQTPTLIIIKTTLGFGAPEKAGSHKAHGAPLGPKETQALKEGRGVDSHASFVVSEAAKNHFAEAQQRSQAKRRAWHQMFERYQRTFPKMAALWAQSHDPKIADAAIDAIDGLSFVSAQSTRQANACVMAAVASHVPQLLGGDGDLSSSTLTAFAGVDNFSDFCPTGAGRHVRFGVREHAMAAAINGMAYHGGVWPFCATFFAFSDYMRPAVRLSALGNLRTLWIWTHDSVALGEDGPTHQPIEHLAAWRAMPNVVVVRPADAHETKAMWQWLVLQHHGPVALVLSRQTLPLLQPQVVASGARRGAYMVSPSQKERPDALILATGAEVHIALAAQKKLLGGQFDVSVVSMPSWEIFLQQDMAYQKSIILPSVTARVAVEAGSSMGWHRFVGPSGEMVCIDRFGISAPGQRALTLLHIDVDAVSEAVVRAIQRCR